MPPERSRTDAEVRALRDAEQSLAQTAHASAEIATMYKTLVIEIGDPLAALELTKSYISAVAVAGAMYRQKESES